MPNLRFVRHFDAHWRAALALNILKHHGVQALLQRGNASAAAKFTAAADFDLFVDAHDYDRAVEVLQQFTCHVHGTQKGRSNVH